MNLEDLKPYDKVTVKVSGEPCDVYGSYLGVADLGGRPVLLISGSDNGPSDCRGIFLNHVKQLILHPRNIMVDLKKKR